MLSFAINKRLQRMKTPIYNPNWTQFRRYLDEDAAAPENNWETARDDEVMTLHKKHGCGRYCVTRTRCHLIDMNVDVVYRMIMDPNLIRLWDVNHKCVRVLEQINENEDVIYVEANAPKPLSNRDLVQYRNYFCNKTNPELVKRYNFYEKMHKYYACFIKTIERDDVPEVDGVVRAEIKLTGWIIEEDPLNAKNTYLTVVNDCDPKGLIPAWIVNMVAHKFALRFLDSIRLNYKMCEDIVNKWTAEKTVNNVSA